MLNQRLLSSKGKRIAIVAALRSPFVRQDRGFKSAYAVDLGAMVTNELLNRTNIEKQQIEQIVFGQVIQQPDIPNIAREISLSLGIPVCQSYTLNNSCISGLQAVVNVATSITSGMISVGIAGGADSISNAPFSISPVVIQKLKDIFKAKNLEKKYQLLRQFSWKDLKPRGISLRDYMTGYSIAEISEQMAQHFNISREAQDEYARHSCEKALNAWKLGLFKEHVMLAFPRPYDDFVVSDTIRAETLRESYYQSQKTLVDSDYATVTSANIPAPVDGAAAILLMREELAKARNLTPLGYIRSYAITGNNVWENMLLGASIASSLALEQAGVDLKQIDVINFHESSASQMLVNQQLFASTNFAQNYLNRTTCIGELDPTKLNQWGGTIAFGNPRAATSLRILVQSLYELRQKNGVLSLIASSGMSGVGAAMVIERE